MKAARMKPTDTPRRDARAHNVARTGWVLASVALVFFVGVILKQWWLGH